MNKIKRPIKGQQYAVPVEAWRQISRAQIWTAGCGMKWVDLPPVAYAFPLLPLIQQHSFGDV
jgi:hypothetical protein